MIEKFVCFAKGGLTALLCVAFVQVGVAGYSVQVTAGQDKGKGTVSVVKLPENGSQADSSVSVILSSEGESAVISAVPANGYKFDKWTLTTIGGGSDATYLYEAEHTVAYTNYSSVAGLSIVQCLAAFSGKDVAVNLDVNVASGHVSPSRVACVFGDAYPALPEPTATGLRFVDWYDAPSGGSLVEPGKTVVANSREHTLYAYWEPMKYTVTFDPGEGEIESGLGAITVTYGDKYPTLPVPVRDRYDFIGWFTAPVNGKEVSAGDVVAITKDATLYARWQIKESEIEYTVALDGCGATKPGTKSVILKKGAKIEGIVLPERTGYAFAGYWSAPEASGVQYVQPDGSPDQAWEGSADATVYAAWAPNTYKVHYFPNGGVGAVVTTNVQYDATFRLAGNLFSRLDGAAFAGWYFSDGSGEYAPGATVVNLAASGSVSLLAKWESPADALNASGICSDLAVDTSAGEQAWRVVDVGVPCLMSGTLKEGKPSSELKAEVSGQGTISFSWCAVGTTSNAYFQVGDGAEGYSRMDFPGPLGLGNWQQASKSIDRAAYAASGGVLVWRTLLYHEEPSHVIVDHTLYVKDVVWKPDGYSKVVFNLNAGAADVVFGGGDSMTVPHGSRYGDIPDPVRSDRQFVGWTTNGVESGVIDPATTVVLPADHALTALWDVEHMGALVPDAEFSGADGTYDYDGSGHTINVAALKAAFSGYDGVTFAYSTSSTGPWSKTPPQQTLPGSLVTHYQASAEGYDSYSGSATASVVYQQKVVVEVTGRSKSVPYDGNEKALSGYDLEILYDNGLYSAAYFTFSGVSSLAETGVGVYRYGLSPRQFANKNPHFKDVVFEIVADGTLEIQPVADVTAKEDVVKLNRGKNVDSAVGAYFSVFSDRLVKSAMASGLPAGVSLEKGADGFFLSGAPTQTGAFDATFVFTLADDTVLTQVLRFLVDDGVGKYALVPADGFAGADVTAEYDGAAHTIDADAIVAAYAVYGGAKVEYSAAASGPWSLTPPARTAPGSLVAHYVVSAEGYDPVTNSATVTVTRRYTVTLDPGEGRLKGDNVVAVDHGAKYPELPEPTRDRYDFKGWWTTAAGGTQVRKDDEVALSGDTTLYAHWQLKSTEIEYTVTLDGNGATKPGTESVSLKQGAKIGEIELPEKTGYAFGGYWSRPDGTGTCFVTADGAAAAAWGDAAAGTIYASWTPNTYKVHYFANGGAGRVFVQTMQYDREDNLNSNYFTNFDNVGFAHWSLADGSATYSQNQSVKNLAASGSVCLHAVWVKSLDPSGAIPSGYCRVAFDLNDGGAGAQFGGCSLIVPHGEFYGDVPDPEWTGHDFLGWTTNGVASGIIDPAGTRALGVDHSLVALWTEAGVEALVPAKGFAGADAKYAYDRAGHTIDVDAIAAAFAAYKGVTITYASSLAEPWGEVPPEQTAPGSQVTYYRVQADGYADYTGCSTIGVVCPSKVVVKVIGPAKTEVFDGNAKTLSGFEVEINDGFGIYSAADFSFSGVSSLVETKVGEYSYGLKPDQFANRNEYFSKVEFEIVTDGKLTILPQEEVQVSGQVEKLPLNTAVKSDVGEYFTVVSGKSVKSATASGLPAGVSLEKGADGFFLSGAPTQSGAFDATLAFTLADGTVLTQDLRFLVGNGAGKYVLEPAAGFAGADVTAVYDGAAHTIDADAIAAAYAVYGGAKVEYSAAAGGPWSLTPPAQTAPGSLKTFYRVSAEGYADVTASATVTVTRKYMVTLDPGEGKFKGDNVIVVDHGEKYPALPEPSRDNYNFTGWWTTAAGGTQVSAGDVVELSGDTTLYAHWQLIDSEIEYTVMLDGCGATKPGTESVRLKTGAKIEGIDLPEKTGYTFNGYWSEQGGYGKRYVNPDGSAGHVWDVAAGTTVYAAWKPNTYKVHYFANGGLGPVETQSVLYDTAFSLLRNPFTNSNNVYFVCWSLADGSERYSQGTSVSNLVAAGDVCFWAEWGQPLDPTGPIPAGYSRVAFDLNDGGAGAQFDGCLLIVPHGVCYGDVPDPEWDGHDFLGWTTNGVMSGIIDPENTAVLNVDHSLIALWTATGVEVLAPAAGFVGADVEYSYDRVGHSIDVDYLASAFSAYKGATITYARSLGEPWVANPPLQTNAGSLATYYRVQANGYADYTGCSTVKVSAPSKVTVKVTGPSASFSYDGAEKTLSGFALEIENGFGVYAVSDVAFSGVSNLTQSAAGVYRYGLSADQFANKNGSFKDVVFEIVADGTLTILPDDELRVSGQTEKLPRNQSVKSDVGAYFSVVSGKLVKSATAFGLPAGVRLEQGADGFFLAGAPTQTGAFDATLVFTLEDGTVVSGGIRFLVSDDNGQYTLAPAAGFAGADVTVEYDGIAHTIDTNAIVTAYVAYGGATIMYSNASTGPWSPTPPAQTGPGSLKTYYRISAEGYSDGTASATVTVMRHYKVTLNPGEGRLLGDDVIVVEHGGKYPELPKPARDRYDFMGWWTTATGGTQVKKDDNVNLSGDTMLYAHWQLNRVDYTVTLDNCGATRPGTQSLIAQTDSELGGIELPKRTGYTFGGYWSETNGTGKCYISSNGLAVAKWSSTSNETIYAHWTPNVYKVYYLPNGEVGAPYSVAVQYGEVFNLADSRFNSLSGKTFVGWQFADGSVSDKNAVVSNLVTSGSVYLLAKWSEVDELNQSGVCHNLSVTSISQFEGNAWSVTNVMINGSNITCLVSGTAKDPDNKNNNSDLTATVDGSGRIEFSWCATGVTTSNKLFYIDGTVKTRFSGGLGLDVGVDETCKISGGCTIMWRKTIDKRFEGHEDDHALYLTSVSWIPDGQYEITFDLADGGTGATFARGMKSMTVASPNTYGDLPDPEWAGHKFVGWTTNGVESGILINPATTAVLAADHTLTALWEDAEVVALEPAAGYPSADVEYAYDANVPNRTINTNALAAAFSKYDDVTFMYSDSPNGPWSTSPPAVNSLGSLTTYIKASAAGYEDYVGSASVKVVWDKKVVVTITGPSAAYDFDGSEKSLAGFGVGISGGGGLYTEVDFAFTGISNCVGTAVGEYTYILEPTQFSNLNPYFSDVVFRIAASGRLSILPVSLVPGAGFAGADAEYSYDGSGRVINTNALAAAFAGRVRVALSYAASPDGPWTAVPPELFGVGSAVTYVKASADGCEDFVTSAVVRVVCDSPVVVKIAGPSKSCYYDGNVKAVSGFGIEVPGWEDLYPASAISFSGVSNLTESAVGEYAYGLDASQFANLDPDFTDVSFEIASDGTLEILPQPHLAMTAAAFDLEQGKNVDSSLGAYFNFSTPANRPVSSYTVAGLPPGVAVYEQSGGYVLAGAPSQAGAFDATCRFVLSDGVVLSGVAKFRVHGPEAGPRQFVPGDSFAEVGGVYAYDGTSRTIDTNALAAAFAVDGVTFEYSDSTNGPWSAVLPVFDGLGAFTTYIKVSADGYADFVTSADVTVFHDAKVLVKITGPAAEYTYDGSGKSLSGFDVEIEDEYGLYSAADFSFDGCSNLTASAVGEYSYGLATNQFTNLNPDFADIVFRIVSDGRLSILTPAVMPLVPAEGFAGADAEYSYDGSGHTIDTNALAAAFPGAALTYAVSPDGPWTAAAPELFGVGGVVTYVKASAEGYSDFVTSAVVRVVCDSPVEVRVYGPSKTCYFDGDEKTLSGFEVEISGGYGLYSAHAFRFEGVSNLTETAVGEYTYGLKPGDFANHDSDFTDVSFEIKSDGLLEILAGPQVKFVKSEFDLELNQPVDSKYGAFFTVDSDRPVASGAAQGLPVGVSLIELSGGKFALAGAPSETGNFEATLEFALADGTVISGSATFCVKSGEVKPKHLVPAAGFAGADASYDYDGAAHTIDTNALAAAFAAYGSVTLEYSATPTGSWSAVAPAFRGPGSAVTYCRASAEGYDVFSTSAVVKVVCSAPVTVKVTGPSMAYFYDGEAKRLSGFEVEIVDGSGLYTVGDFSFSGKSNLVATAAGVYVYGLKPGQFANRNANFSNVAFEIVSDGRLEIVAPDEPSPALGPLWPNDSAYDGSVARVYDGWAIAPGGILAAVVQLRAAKLQTRKGVTSFTATATVKDEAAKSWSYSKGVGTADGVVTGLVSAARNVPVATFGATLGADNFAGEWGGCEIFGARAGMGVKGDKMADALEAYRGSWTLMLTNAAGTTRLQLVVGARGSTKISGDVADVSVAGGYKVNATVQSVMGEDGLYVPYLAVLRKGAFSLNASLLAKLTPSGAVTVFCSGFGPLVAGGRTVEELGEISYPEDDPPRAGEVFSAFVSVNDLTYPVRFSARGLPAGLRINATSGEVSGTPTKPGVYRVVVTAVSGINSKVKVERTLTIAVNNFVDGLIPVKDSYGPARVGVKFMLDLAGSAAGTSASGLPAGLKFATRATKDSVFGNVPAWTVYGVPTKAVTNAVIFKKSGKDPVSGRTVTHVASSTLPVEGLDPWARGNFAGAAFANSGDDDPNGLLPSLSVSAAGKLSGKFIDADGATWTLSAPAYDDYDPAAPSYSASVLCKSGKLVATNRIELLARDLGGEAYGVVSGSDPVWTAWQSPWANEPWKSTAKQFAGRQFVVDDGAGGTITLKLAAAGAVSAKLATTATNPKTGATVAYSATCSSTLVPLGGGQYVAFVHFPPKATATVSFPGCSIAVPLEL